MNRVLAIACVLFAMIGSAQAVSLTGSVALQSTPRPAGQGLQIGAALQAPHFSLDLIELGDTRTLSLFNLFVTERTRRRLGADDFTPRDVVVSFDIGGVTATIVGSQAAGRFLFEGRRFERNAGIVTWDDPIVIALGDGREVTVSLSDEAFSGRFRGLGHGQGRGRGLDSGPVEATFTLSAVPVTAVPVPAALPLLATALGLIGWLGRRRRR